MLNVGLRLGDSSWWSKRMKIPAVPKTKKIGSARRTTNAAGFAVKREEVIDRRQIEGVERKRAPANFISIID